MGQFNVTMPDGTTKSVQGTTLAAAVNNAGPGASAPGSGGGGSVSVQSAPSSNGGGGGGTFNPQGSTAAMNAAGFADTPAGRAAQAAGQPGNTAALVGGQSSGGNGAAPATVDQGFNSAAAQQAIQLANNAAQQAYNNARLQQLEIPQFQALTQQAKDQLAFDKAKEAWSETFQQANADIANKNATANITGTFDGQPTLAAQTQQQTAANQYLSLIAGLRGPNDPVQYLRTLQGTPQGLKDIVNAAAGRYQLGGAPSGEQAAAATVGGQLANMNAAQGGANPLDPLAQALPPANQIDSRAYNAMLPSQKAGLWSVYEYGGPSGAMNPADAQVMYQNSLPKYGGPATGSFLSPASGGAVRNF